MIVRITRTVPGLMDFKILAAGDVTELHDATANALIADGYAEPADGATPLKASETAAVVGKGRARVKA